MSLLERLSNLRSNVSRNRVTGRIAAVHWDRERIYFLVVSPKSKSLVASDVGVVAHAESGNPFLALAQHFIFGFGPAFYLAISFFGFPVKGK